MCAQHLSQKYSVTKKEKGFQYKNSYGKYLCSSDSPISIFLSGFQKYVNEKFKWADIKCVSNFSNENVKIADGFVEKLFVYTRINCLEFHILFTHLILFVYFVKSHLY